MDLMGDLFAKSFSLKPRSSLLYKPYQFPRIPRSIPDKVRVFSRASLTRLSTTNKYNLFLMCFRLREIESVIACLVCRFFA